MRGKAVAVLAAVWLAAGLVANSNRMLTKMAAQGERLREQRARPEDAELGAVVLGWSNRTRDGRAIMDAITRDIDTAALSLLELYVDGPENAGFWHEYLNPFPVAPRVDVMISLQFKNAASMTEPEVLRKALDTIEKATTLKSLLKEFAVYVVNRSLYTDYGEYDGPAVDGWDPSRKIDWPKGSRSPYVTTVTCFTKPKQYSGLSPMEWAREKWWKIQSPMSEIMQPRPRYVRNVVLQASPGAPPFGGIVVEAWPSKDHMLNLFRFFDAAKSWDLLVRIVVMLRSTTQFASLSELQSIVLSEYLML